MTIPRDLEIDVYPCALLLGASFTLDGPPGALRIAWGIDYLESRRLRQMAKTRTADCGEALRVLSEKTKFEILLALREAPRYGCVVADLLGLRPDTVSHHMGELLRHGLVTVEPRQNRVYYTLHRERLKEVLAQAGSCLGARKAAGAHKTTGAAAAKAAAAPVFVLGSLFRLLGHTMRPWPWGPHTSPTVPPSTWVM